MAGPPFRTDDPQPVDYRHWEFYLASQYQKNTGGVSATAPHVEINYGVRPDFQLHLILPMEYAKPRGQPSHYGYSDTELGLKWRFYSEKRKKFMAGSFPLVEIPTGEESRGLGNGAPQVFIPLWLQKEWGPWLSNVGGGYWFNSGAGHRDFQFLGAMVQRDVNRYWTLGAEIFYQTPSDSSGAHEVGFNAGGFLKLTKNQQILFTAGSDIHGPNSFFYYLAYYLTFGPGEEKGGLRTPGFQKGWPHSSPVDIARLERE
ncbi:MAG: hypothetical protein P4L43_08280 [Syntrophobacteraceae bacterium]|nr:hypothetical protein [Syntrophobacteraceae bacterium]